MIEIAIPGYRTLQLQYLVMDYNGTLASDGNLVTGVGEAVTRLATDLDIHVVTADTFGKAASELEGLPLTLTILPLQNQDQAKLDYVGRLGAESVVAIGNGRNDRLMLHAAALGIAVILYEGAALQAMSAADIVCTSAESALDLLTETKRLIATLRS